MPWKPSKMGTKRRTQNTSYSNAVGVSAVNVVCYLLFS